MNYTVVRNTVKSGIKSQYNYTISELPEFSAGTNYKEYIKKATWHAEYNDNWYLEQSNTILRWTDFIPIINAIITFFQYRKYKIFHNNMCVGIVDRLQEKGKLTVRTRFTINDKEYFINNGNTNFIRPGKKYEWSIADQYGQIVAFVGKMTKEPKYNLQTTGDIPIEITVIMMCDVSWFSNEYGGPVTSADFR